MLTKTMELQRARRGAWKRKMARESQAIECPLTKTPITQQFEQSYSPIPIENFDHTPMFSDQDASNPLASNPWATDEVMEKPIYDKRAPETNPAWSRYEMTPVDLPFVGVKKVDKPGDAKALAPVRDIGVHISSRPMLDARLKVAEAMTPDVFSTPILTPIQQQQLARFRDFYLQQQQVATLEPVRQTINATPLDQKSSYSFALERNNRYLQEDDGSATIFVSVASYRDPELPATVWDAFAKARFPQRVFVGVIEQNDPQDNATCSLSGTNPKFPVPMSQVRVIRMEAKSAKGPVFARHRVQTELYQGEDFFLQVDAHMVFAENWDSFCLGQWGDINDPSAVLTTYPNEYDYRNRKKVDVTGPATYMAFASFDNNTGMPFTTKKECQAVSRLPVPSLFWSANFSFSRGELVTDVTYPPDLDFAFTGEEFLMAMRMYSRGWNMYHPSMQLALHLSRRDHRPGTFWENFHMKKAKARGVPLPLIVNRKSAFQSSVEALQNRVATQSDSTLSEKSRGQFLFGFNRDVPSITKIMRSPGEFENYCGVSVSAKRAEPRASMGLTSEPDQDEMTAKGARSTAATQVQNKPQPPQQRQVRMVSRNNFTGAFR